MRLVPIFAGSPNVVTLASRFVATVAGQHVSDTVIDEVAVMTRSLIGERTAATEGVSQQPDFAAVCAARIQPESSFDSGAVSYVRGDGGTEAGVSLEQVRYSVLGSLRAWRADMELDLGQPKQLAVLAMLLLNANALVPQTAIIDGVWGDEAPATVVNLVYTYVSRLRRILEPVRGPHDAYQLLVGEPSGYMLHVGPGQLDLEEFQNLLDQAKDRRAGGDLAGAVDAYTAALRLWNVSPLAGVPGPVAEAERSRLAELHSTVLEDRAEAILELGGHHELAGELLALAAEHPLRERTTALLMTALYQSGRQAEALEVYMNTRALLAEQLGIDPGPGLQQLHQRILAADPALAGSNGAGAEPGPGMPATVPHQLPADIPHFVGRAEQLRQLVTLLETATGAGGTAVIGAVDGMCGVGKSALAIHAAHQAADAGSFPDGQLYINLQGATPGLEPVDSLEALG